MKNLLRILFQNKYFVLSITKACIAPFCIKRENIIKLGYKAQLDKLQPAKCCRVLKILHFDTLVRSCQCNHCEANFIGVSGHELLAHLSSIF